VGLRATVHFFSGYSIAAPRKDARHIVEICNWFTEGFDTPDLKNAKALLEELSR